jgi:hypothetical protein
MNLFLFGRGESADLSLITVLVVGSGRGTEGDWAVDSPYEGRDFRKSAFITSPPSAVTRQPA